MTIGLFFGSFDPPHNGHTAIASHIRKAAGLDAVWLVVTPQNPFKLDRPLSPEADRLRMVQLAVQDHPGLTASGFELVLPKPNYTVDTLAAMRATWPSHTFALLMGSDNLAALHRWKDPEGILVHHRVLVYPRPGVEAHLHDAPYARHPAVTVVGDAPLLDISATDIRSRVREGLPVDGLVAPAVAAYIRERGLYRD
jgi:nicotinate-nucleotide adenylyltransferase